MKKIAIIVSSSIAWIKIPALVQLLEQENFQVKILATKNFQENALECHLKFEHLNEKMHFNDQANNYPADHIAWARETDLVICAPASMNFLSALSLGLAPEIVYAFLHAYKKKVIFAPSMNDTMWEHLQSFEHFQRLQRQKENYFLGPNYGRLYEGYEGWGRMAEPEEIFALVKNLLYPLKDPKIYISYGSSRVHLDDIRYIQSNASGKFAFYIAKELEKLGYKSHLINAQNFSNQALLEKLLGAKIYIASAALANFKVTKYEGKKSGSNWNIALTKDLDVIAELAKRSPQTKVFAFKYDHDPQKAFKKVQQNKNIKGMLFNQIGAMNNEIVTGEMILKKSKKTFQNAQKSLIAKEIAKEISKWI